MRASMHLATPDSNRNGAAQVQGHSMTEYPGLAWLARYRERVNADPELR